MENQINQQEQDNPEKKKRSHAWIFILVIAVLVLFYFIFGFVTIQPIGAIPDGITLLIVRAGTQMKFFDSADAMCLRLNDNEVSLLCRLAALSAIAENSKIIARLPYINAFYLASTHGVTFEK